MDGRVQLPVIEYLQKRFNAEHVDMITEPGPNLILAAREKTKLVESILARLKISVEKHHSTAVAIVAHHDCAGNPTTKGQQILHLQDALIFIKQQYSQIEVIGLWVDENLQANEITAL